MQNAKTKSRLLAALLTLLIIFTMTPMAGQTAYAETNGEYTVILSPGDGTGEARTFSCSAQDIRVVNNPFDASPGEFYRLGENGRVYFNAPDVPDSFQPPEGVASLNRTWAGANPGAAIEVVAGMPVTLAASWSVPSIFTVTFHGNGGTINGASSIEVKTGAGGRLDALPEPKHGNVSLQFLGWFTGPTAGDAVSEETMFAENTELFAKWGLVSNTFSLVLDANYDGGPVLVYSDVTSVILPAPSRPADVSKIPADALDANDCDFSFAFKGWAASPTGEPEYAADSSISKQTDIDLFAGGDPTLYAIWEPKDVNPDAVSRYENGAPFYDANKATGGSFPGGAGGSETPAIQEAGDGNETYGFLKSTPIGTTPGGDHSETGALYKEDGTAPFADMTAEAFFQDNTKLDPAPQQGGFYAVGEDTFDTLEAAIDSASGKVIRVLCDHTEGALVPVASGKRLVLDLNGKTLTMAGLQPSGGLDITIQGTGGGTLKLTGTGEFSGIAPKTSKKVNLTATGGSILSDGLLLYSTGSGSSVTITGGTISCAGATQSNSNGQGAVSGSGISAVNFSGGSFTVYEGMVIRAKNAAVTITGGSFLSTGLEIVREAKSLTVSGGTFIGNGTVNNTSDGTTEIHGTGVKSVTVTGGTFKRNLTGKGEIAYLKENEPYMWADAADGMYQVVPAVARVEDLPAAGEYTKYGTFQAAAAAAVQNGKVLTLLNIPAQGDTYTLAQGQTLKVRAGAFTVPVLPEDGVTVTVEGDAAIYQLKAQYAVSYEVEGGHFPPGATTSEKVYENDKPTGVPAGMAPDTGFRDAGAWYRGTTKLAGGPADEAISQDTIFTYKFDAKAQYAVSYEVEGGHFPPGATTSEKVYENDKPAGVPAGMAPDTGFRDAGAWYRGTTKLAGGPADETISQDTIFTYKFDAKAQYAVSYEVEGGHFPPGATTSEKVYENDKPTGVPAGMAPDAGFLDAGAWYRGTTKLAGGPADETISQDTIFTYKFDAKAQHTVAYEAEGGGGITWTKGSNSAVTLTIKRSEEDNTCFAHFTGVEIDGTALVKDTDYTAVSGSTVVTIKATALQKLSVGSHAMAVNFDDGKATATITVKAASGGENNNHTVLPDTGDESNIALWLALMIVSAFGIAASVCAERKMCTRRRRR